jgi:hypothetical protein
VVLINLRISGGILTVHGVSASIFKRLLACFYGGLLDGKVCWPAIRIFELFYTFHVSWVKIRKQSNFFTSQTVSAWRFSFLKGDCYRLDQLQKHY